MYKKKEKDFSVNTSGKRSFKNVISVESSRKGLKFYKKSSRNAIEKS